MNCLSVLFFSVYQANPNLLGILLFGVCFCISLQILGFLKLAEHIINASSPAGEMV